MKRLTLQNNLLQVEILPAIGGKIVSLLSVRTGEEFLLPPLNDYTSSNPFSDFSASSCGGFDECFPSVASCAPIGNEGAIPDHGDLWRIAWQVQSECEPIIQWVHATSRPLRLTRTASLEAASLVLRYELINLSDAPATWLWSAHPLLRVEAGDRIVLPPELQQVAVEYSNGDLLKTNSNVSWPIAQAQSGTAIDLSTVGESDGQTAHKLFAIMGRSGWAGLYRSNIQEGILVEFDPALLPFLGLWICCGAWPTTSQAKQYAVALEPTTSNKDSLVDAVDNGTHRILKTRETFRWTVTLSVLGALRPISFEEFCATARERGSI